MLSEYSIPANFSIMMCGYLLFFSKKAMIFIQNTSGFLVIFLVTVYTINTLNTIKALTRRSIFFLKQREGTVGVSSRVESLEGSL